VEVENNVKDVFWGAKMYVNWFFHCFFFTFAKNGF